MVKKVKTLVAIGVAGMGLGGLLKSCTIVPAGDVTVLDTFGSVRAEELNSGLNWPVNPLFRRVRMDVRT